MYVSKASMKVLYGPERVQPVWESLLSMDPSTGLDFMLGIETTSLASDQLATCHMDGQKVFSVHDDTKLS